LKQGLQAAIELELATLPPYLCGLWSIKSQDGPAFNLIESVALEEMLHMGLSCNMLVGIGGHRRFCLDIKTSNIRVLSRAGYDLI
jgi:hypothetical protein